jgi:glutamate dehydrogenase
LAKASQDSYERKVERYILNNVEPALARKVAAMDAIASAFDIAEISTKSKVDLKIIAKIYFAVGTRFSLKWLRSKLSDIPSDNYWQKLSSKSIVEDLYLAQMKIASQIVDSNNKKGEICEVESTEIWIEKNQAFVERYDNFITDLKANPSPDLSMFVVALNRLKPLIH